MRATSEATIWDGPVQSLPASPTPKYGKLSCVSDCCIRLRRHTPDLHAHTACKKRRRMPDKPNARSKRLLVRFTRLFDQYEFNCRMRWR
jgi:hypothetical protein